MKVLMVCLGNICRSPLAEGILQMKIKAQGLDWEVDSAGTGAWHVGEQPDRRSIQVARKNGIDITYQRARQFQAQDLDTFDLIFAMDQSNLANILRKANNTIQEKKVHLIMNQVDPNANRSVPDPYYDDDGFEQVYEMLDKACDKIIARWV
ncbi:MAG: low molecular weight phosphotyrosine protein phosphatase [Saprospiraceae bacterium]|nr:low molecular weight phosphotyrosine protein phosphatase [Saprospiraceae bacterium]